jgi:hypothetical protein
MIRRSRRPAFTVFPLPAANIASPWGEMTRGPDPAAGNSGSKGDEDVSQSFQHHVSSLEHDRRQAKAARLRGRRQTAGWQANADNAGRAAQDWQGWPRPREEHTRRERQGRSRTRSAPQASGSTTCLSAAGAGCRPAVRPRWRPARAIVRWKAIFRTRGTVAVRDRVRPVADIRLGLVPRLQCPRRVLPLSWKCAALFSQAKHPALHEIR